MKKKIGSLDYDVTNIELEHGINAGIKLYSTSENAISPYREHSARISAGISLEDWIKMRPADRALTVAVQEVERAVQNHNADAEISEMNRTAPKAK